MVDQPAQGATMECYKCGLEVIDAKEYWCYGCEEVICDDCGEAPWGGHIADEHTPPCPICGEAHLEEDCDVTDE